MAQLGDARILIHLAAGRGAIGIFIRVKAGRSRAVYVRRRLDKRHTRIY